MEEPIGGLPSISTFSLLFIGLDQSPQAAADATRAFPIALSFTILFLIVYALTVPKGPVIALSAAILVWLGFSIPTAAYNFENFPLELIVLAIVSAAGVLILREMRLASLKRGNTTPTAQEILRRGLAGGAVVGTVVLLSQELGPIWGGVFSAFPAVFSLTLLFTYKTEGEGVLPRDGQAPDDPSPYNRVTIQHYRGTFVSSLRSLARHLCVAPIAYLLLRIR